MLSSACHPDEKRLLAPEGSRRFIIAHVCLLGANYAGLLLIIDPTPRNCCLQNSPAAAGAGNEKDIGKVAARARAQIQPAYLIIILVGIEELVRSLGACKVGSSLDFITEN